MRNYDRNFVIVHDYGVARY